MNRCNPLLAEALRGLGGSGPAHSAYLNYLAVQAVVLFLWWPKSALVQVLQTEDGPDTLLAVVIALGATVAYYAIRAGAEEILLPGQHPLREWALATPLTLPRIVRGYLCGHFVQTLHAMVLSSPLLLAAFSVGGGEWPALAWSLTAVLFQATFYRLVGAVAYLLIGHHEAITFFSLRAFLLAGYTVAAALLPVTSHLVVSSRLLNPSPSMEPSGGSLPIDLVFLLVYGVASAVLVVVLYLVLSHQRRVTVAPLGLEAGRPLEVDTPR